MRPLSRKPVHKRASARSFKHHIRKTKSVNLITHPMRGGIRL